MRTLRRTILFGFVAYFTLAGRSATAEELQSMPGSWNYGFQPSATSVVTVELTGLSADLDLLVLEDVGGGCDPTSCIGASAHRGSTDESVTFTAESGTTYYVVVDGFAGAVSEFTVAVGCSIPDRVFLDGFETGDLSAWSAVVPPP